MLIDDALRNTFQGNWKQLSGSVHHEWGKLTHNDVEQIKGNVEVLSGKIQKLYGVTEAEAGKQIVQWIRKIHTYQKEQSSSNTPTD